MLQWKLRLQSQNTNNEEVVEDFVMEQKSEDNVKDEEICDTQVSEMDQSSKYTYIYITDGNSNQNTDFLSNGSEPNHRKTMVSEETDDQTKDNPRDSYVSIEEETEDETTEDFESNNGNQIEIPTIILDCNGHEIIMNLCLM